MNRMFQQDDNSTDDPFDGMCEHCQASMRQGVDDATDNKSQIIEWIRRNPLREAIPIPKPWNASELHNPQAYCEGYGRTVDTLLQEYVLTN